MARVSADGTKILENYDRYTGVPFNATKVTAWLDGSPMDDSKVDNAIYFKNRIDLGGGYSKRDFESVIQVEWFGCKADNGNTDNYLPFKLLAAYLNASGGNVSVSFEKGIYFIDQYRITSGVDANGITNIIYSSLRNVVFIGNGCTISCKGNFNRSSDSGNVSYRNSVMPFVFQICKNITFSGFEINGNVNLMTRPSNVVEAPNHGLSLQGCENFEISNVYTHNWCSDGFFIGNMTISGGFISSKYITADNVISSHNARQALSITGLYSGLFTNCSFIYSGDTEGLYQGHSPQAGVDIEPNHTVLDGSDINTGFISFEECTFQYNIGWQFVSGLPARVSKIRISNCKISKRGGQENQNYTFSLTSNDSIIENSLIEGDMRIINGGGGGVIDEGISGHLGVTVRNNTFKAFGQQRRGVITSYTDTSFKFIFVDNTFVYDTDLILDSYFPYIQGFDSIFTGNRIIFRSTSHQNLQNPTLPAAYTASLLQRLAVCDNNTLDVLQITGFELNSNQYFVADFTNSRSLNNIFLSINIKPFLNNIYYNRQGSVFSNGKRHLGSIGVLGGYDTGTGGGRQLTFMKSPPTSGVWNKGDVILSNVENQSYLGWKCLTDSSEDGVTIPATWGLMSLKDYKITVSTSSINSDPDYNEYIEANSTAPRTVTLRGASNAPNEFIGCIKIIKKINANLAGMVTISPATGIVIDGYSSIILPKQGDYAVLIYVGSNNWKVIDLHINLFVATPNTTDVITLAFLNTTYPTTTYPVGSVISYYNKGMEYRRETSSLWSEKPLNLIL